MDSVSYKILVNNVEDVLYKERGSKFIGYAYNVTKEEMIKDYLEQLRLKHNNANHHCYAWQLGEEQIQYRTNDDGEPSYTAGIPIYGQIQAHELTNVLLVVVRYFGGKKLGAGGLIAAYRSTAQLTLEAARLKAFIPQEDIIIEFEYPIMNKVMRIIKKYDLQIVSQTMELNCSIKLSVPKSELDNIKRAFSDIRKLIIK